MKVKHQQIWIVAFACLIIALYVVSKLFPFFPAGSALNVAFHDAVVMCEKETRTHFAEHLRNINFDESSSRHDKSTGRHRIFFSAQLNTSRAADLYILCVIDTSNGKMLQLDAVEPPTADKNNKENRFGWPAR